MGQESLPVMLKAMDEIFMPTTRRSCVKETRVFIPLGRDANVEARAPVCKAFIVDGLDCMCGESAQDGLVRSQRTNLLQQIESLHKESCVGFTLVQRTQAA